MKLNVEIRKIKQDLFEKINKLELKKAKISINAVIDSFQYQIERGGDKDFFKNEIGRMQLELEKIEKELKENNDE